MTVLRATLLATAAALMTACGQSYEEKQIADARVQAAAAQVQTDAAMEEARKAADELSAELKQNAAETIARGQAAHAAAVASMDANIPPQFQPAAVTSGAGTTQLSPAYMAGKWSVFGDCTATVEFKRDGTLVMPFGNAKWSLSGDKLTFSGEGFRAGQVSTIKVVDANTITTTSAKGRVEQQKRCA